MKDQPFHLLFNGLDNSQASLLFLQYLSLLVMAESLLQRVKIKLTHLPHQFHPSVHSHLVMFALNKSTSCTCYHKCQKMTAISSRFFTTSRPVPLLQMTLTRHHYFPLFQDRLLSVHPRPGMVLLCLGFHSPRKCLTLKPSYLLMDLTMGHE